MHKKLIINGQLYTITKYFCPPHNGKAKIKCPMINRGKKFLGN